MLLVVSCDGGKTKSTPTLSNWDSVGSASSEWSLTKNDLLSHKKQEAHLVENCGKHHRKKNSALSVMHGIKQSIASKLANMFAKVWCYSLGP